MSAEMTDLSHRSAVSKLPEPVKTKFQAKDDVNVSDYDMDIELKSDDDDFDQPPKVNTSEEYD